jgi:methylated-DNA-[protein]-cysteine S-methyltransferase
LQVLLRTTLKTPVGALSLISREHILIAAGFTSQDELLSSISKQDKQLESKKVSQIPIISDLITDYFDGDLRALDGIKVDQEGEKFSQSAWRVMRKIPPGKTLTYADLAKRAGSKDAVRAAGSACARNLIALVVPCHRIVKTGGALGNYAYGLKYKQWLLSHEGAL